MDPARSQIPGEREAEACRRHAHDGTCPRLARTAELRRALAWALHGWQPNATPGESTDRYYAVVRLLVAAGAVVKPEWLEDERVRNDLAMLEALRRG